MVCPVVLQSFYLSRDSRNLGFCFTFLLQFGFKNTECFCSLIIINDSIHVLPDMPQSCISQESRHWVVPEFVVVLKISQNVFEANVVFTVRWKSLSDQCGNIVPDVFGARA